MLAELYLAYEQKLKEIINPETGEAYFKHFDLWHQNVEFIEEESGLDFPAVFFEFSPIQWKTIGNRVQESDLTIRLHIVTERHTETFENTPEQIRLDCLHAPSVVVRALQGFCTPFSNGLMRTQSIINHDHSEYVDSVEEYVCRVRDYSAQPESITVNLDPKITTFTQI